MESRAFMAQAAASAAHPSARATPMLQPGFTPLLQAANAQIGQAGQAAGVDPFSLQLQASSPPPNFGLTLGGSNQQQGISRATSSGAGQNQMQMQIPEESLNDMLSRIGLGRDGLSRGGSINGSGRPLVEQGQHQQLQEHQQQMQDQLQEAQQPVSDEYLNSFVEAFRDIDAGAGGAGIHAGSGRIQVAPEASAPGDATVTAAASLLGLGQGVGRDRTSSSSRAPPGLENPNSSKSFAPGSSLYEQSAYPYYASNSSSSASSASAANMSSATSGAASTIQVATRTGTLGNGFASFDPDLMSLTTQEQRAFDPAQYQQQHAHHAHGHYNNVYGGKGRNKKEESKTVAPWAVLAYENQGLIQNEASAGAGAGAGQPAERRFVAGGVNAFQSKMDDSRGFSYQ